MNTEKLEKLEKFKKQLDNKLIPDGVKDKIRNEIEKLESEIKSEDITATELKKEVAKVEEKVEVAVEKAEKKAESTEPKKGRGRPRKTPATTPAEPKATETAIKKTAMVVAKTIRKDGEKWNDAMKRANGVMKKEKVEVKKTTKSELDRLLARVRKNKSLMSELKGVKDLGRDAVRQAKPVGKRMSESGNVYYEYRANKTDRKTYGKYAFAGGGDISDVTYAIFNPNQKNGKIETSFGDKTKEGLFAMITNVNYSPEEISKAIFDANDKNGKIKTTYGDKTFSGLTEIIKNVRNTYELGGSVVTDLAGHTGGGNAGLNAGMPLDGFSNTAYTGLVGETGAMSSGEMFMSGGRLTTNRELLEAFLDSKKELKVGNLTTHYSTLGDVIILRNYGTIIATRQGKKVNINSKKYSNTTTTITNLLEKLANDRGMKVMKISDDKFMSGGSVGMANQQVIDDASQGYVNYYLGEGASAGIYKDGGAIKNQYAGRTPEDVWNNLNTKQRLHFLFDHFLSNSEKFLNREEYLKAERQIAETTKDNWNSLPRLAQIEFESHVNMGQYAKGGGVRQVGNREYSYGRNWTNDHRHVNQSEEHEVNYTRKGKFLGVFAGGGQITISEIKRRTSETSPYFFDAKTMKFFNQKMSDFKVRKLENGKYEISAPRKDSNGKSMGVTKRIFNPETNELEFTKDFADGGEIYTIAENMTDADYNKNYNNLNEKQKERVKILIRLGDTPKLALATILFGNFEINSNSDTYKLYTMAKGGGLTEEGYYVFDNKRNVIIADSFKTEKEAEKFLYDYGLKYPNKNLSIKYNKGEMMAKGGGVRQVGNREYSTGRNWTNDHRHTNKSEEHEVNYNRKRFFAGGGGVDDDTPKIYVADLEAYNNGRLSGVWLDLTDYSDADELMDAINDFLKTTGGEEYAVHDYENLPSSMYSEYMGVRDFEEIYEMLDLAKENDLPLDVVMEVVSQFDRSALDEYTGVYDSEQDFAEQLVDDIGITSFIDFRYYLEISETDRRLLAQEEADYYADAIRYEDGGNRLIEEADLDVEEYEEADSERQEEMLDEAREIVYDRIYDRTYDALDDPYSYFVEELGSYDDESFANANFVRVDYEKLGDALEQDYTFVRHDGQIYVFNIR
jgi:antirestriction protein